MIMKTGHQRTSSLLLLTILFLASFSLSTGQELPSDEVRGYHNFYHQDNHRVNQEEEETIIKSLLDETIDLNKLYANISSNSLDWMSTPVTQDNQGYHELLFEYLSSNGFSTGFLSSCPVSILLNEDTATGSDITSLFFKQGFVGGKNQRMLPTFSIKTTKGSHVEDNLDEDYFSLSTQEVNPLTTQVIIRLNKQIDRERHPFFSFDVQADSSLSSTSCNIQVTVKDSNDNLPIFEKSIYSSLLHFDLQDDVQDVTASKNRMKFVTQVSASDQDFNETLFYSLNCSSVESDCRFFYLNSSSGEIFTDISLLISSNKLFFSFPVFAFTSSSSDLLYLSNTTVSVTLVLSSNIPPKFKHYPYVILDVDVMTTTSLIGRLDLESLGSSSAGVRFVFREDILRNHQDYSCSSLLNLDPVSGLLSLKSLGEVTNKFNYDFMIECFVEVQQKDSIDFIYDHKPMAASSTSSLTLLQVFFFKSRQNNRNNALYNKKASPALQIQVDIRENSVVETPVVDLIDKSKMPSLRNNRIFNISYSSLPGIFKINLSNGVVSVSRKILDREVLQTSFIHLIVVAINTLSDQTPPVFFDLTINIINEPDNNPVFCQSTFNSVIKEGLPRGSFVSSILVSDVEKTMTNAKFKITEGNIDNAFSLSVVTTGLEATSSVVTVVTNSVLDREIKSFYSLTISVLTTSGHGNNTIVTTTLNIFVSDVDDNIPVFPSFSTVVPESREVGSLVSTVKANDIDLEPDLRYSLVTNGMNEDSFYIEPFSGKLFMKKSLKHLKEDHLSVKIQAQDSKHSVSTEVRMEIHRGNRPLLENHSQSIQVILLNQKRIQKECLVELNSCPVTKINVKKTRKQVLLFQIRPVFKSNSSIFSIDSSGVVYVSSTERRQEQDNQWIPVEVIIGFASSLDPNKITSNVTRVFLLFHFFDQQKLSPDSQSVDNSIESRIISIECQSTKDDQEVCVLPPKFLPTGHSFIVTPDDYYYLSTGSKQQLLRRKSSNNNFNQEDSASKRLELQSREDPALKFVVFLKRQSFLTETLSNIKSNKDASNIIDGGSNSNNITSAVLSLILFLLVLLVTMFSFVVWRVYKTSVDSSNNNVISGLLSASSRQSSCLRVNDHHDLINGSLWRRGPLYSGSIYSSAGGHYSSPLNEFEESGTGCYSQLTTVSSLVNERTRSSRTSSGRGTSDEEDEDEEVKMIIQGNAVYSDGANNYYDQTNNCVKNNVDLVSSYLLNLGVSLDPNSSTRDHFNSLIEEEEFDEETSGGNNRNRMNAGTTNVSNFTGNNHDVIPDEDDDVMSEVYSCRSSSRIPSSQVVTNNSGVFNQNSSTSNSFSVRSKSLNKLSVHHRRRNNRRSNKTKHQSKTDDKTFHEDINFAYNLDFLSSDWTPVVTPLTEILKQVNDVILENVNKNRERDEGPMYGHRLIE